MKTVLTSLAAAIAALAGAQPVPPLINYQGRLANADGTPFPTADYELRVSLYDTATDGSLVWGPQVFDGAPGTGHGPRLPMVQGYFNVMLGPVDTQGRSILDAFGDSNRFVEVTVSNRPPILPRQQILTTPYAFRAGDIADGVVTIRKLAPRPTGANVPLGGVAISSTISHITAATEPESVPGLEVTIETSGHPVLVFLSSGTGGGVASIETYDSAASGLAQAVFGLWRNSSNLVGQYLLENAASGGISHGSAIPSSTVRFMDTPQAGIHTYSIKMNMRPGNRDARISNSRLVAYEL